MHDFRKEKESRPANLPWFGWRDCLKPLSRSDAAHNTVFQLTGAASDVYNSGWFKIHEVCFES